MNREMFKKELELLGFDKVTYNSTYYNHSNEHTYYFELTAGDINFKIIVEDGYKSNGVYLYKTNIKENNKLMEFMPETSITVLKYMKASLGVKQTPLDYSSDVFIHLHNATTSIDRSIEQEDIEYLIEARSHLDKVLENYEKN